MPNASAQLKADGPAAASGSALVVPVRALLVGTEDDGMRALADALRARDIAPTIINPKSADPFDLLTRDPRISVLGVYYGQLGRANQDRLLHTIFDQPALTSFVIGVSRKAESVLRKHGVGHVFSIRDKPSDIADALAASLSEHDFDTCIVGCLRDSLAPHLVNTSLASDPGAALLRAGGSMLGQLSAVIAFGGDGLSGRVTIAGPSVFFERLAREWTGEKPRTREGIWDAAGELCNRLAGTVRQHYAREGLNSRQSVPMIVEGEGAVLRSVTSKPGLVVPFEVERVSDPVYVELVLAWRDESCRQDPLTPSDEMPTGELTFL